MGLVARAIERAGVATTAVSIVREITEKLPPPRSVYFRFPFGHALGEPGNKAQHFAVLYKAFALLFSAVEPGEICDGGIRWRRDRNPEVDWKAFAGLGPDRGKED